MKRGFATILVAASVFLVAIILFSQANTTDVSYNSSFSEINVAFDNYTIIMFQAAQDCNWEKNVTQINDCLNINSENAKQIFNSTDRVCEIGSFSSQKDTNTAQTTVLCKIVIDSGNNGFFSLDINKLVKIKKIS